MIELTHVSKRFGSIQAVRDVSCIIEKGQVVGVLGPNGAGKSTTIRMITAAMPPTSGVVKVDGRDTVDDSLAVRRRLGYLPESNPLYPEMSVRGYLRYRAGIFGVGRRDRKKAIGRAIERCWLTDVSARRVGHLSKGYRQRVGLAAALIHDPPVLILDEPTNGLDPSQIAETRSLIRDLAGDRTMLLVSHILPEVERTCDRMIIFSRGSIRADGTPADLLSKGGETIVMEAKCGTGDQVRALIAGVAGADAGHIESVDGGWQRVRIHADHGSTGLRESLARTCLDAGVLVRELSTVSESLESLYLRLVQGTGDNESCRSAPEGDES